MKQEEKYIEYDERIDRYLRNLMDDSERTAFEHDVDNDQELRERLVATAMLVNGIAQAGMQREGQAQLDVIKQMNREEYIQATQGKKVRNPMWTFMKWASGIAAVAIVAFCFYTLRPATTGDDPVIAQNEQAEVSRPTQPKKPTKPTLASLVKEYNRPIAGEPDKFVAIRQKIQSEQSNDMMAVVFDIDNVEAPQYVEGAKGAEDADAIKETQRLYSDCTHWYKALAFLKRRDKDRTISELNELIEQSHNEILVERATELLKKLK